MVPYCISFRTGHGHMMRAGWWGILGLIGWAYLFAAGAYLLCRKKPWTLVLILLGLCFVNLVDFDALWGHRRDPKGYGDELERFDEKLAILLEQLKEDDLLMITADHGNDPTYTGTDHTREKVPLLMYSPSFDQGKQIDEQETFAVIGATVAENFGVKMPEGTIGKAIL